MGEWIINVKRAKIQNEFKQKPGEKHVQKDSTCKDLILTHYKLEVGGSVAKFESLLRFFVSILGNTLERIVRKAIAQSCQTR